MSQNRTFELKGIAFLLRAAEGTARWILLSDNRWHFLQIDDLMIDKEVVCLRQMDKEMTSAVMVPIDNVMAIAFENPLTSRYVWR